MHPILRPALARLLLGTALALALVAAPAIASPNAEPDPASRPTYGGSGASASAVTDHLKYIVTGLRDDRVLEVWDEETETEHLVRIAEGVDITARRKKDFDGRSDLVFSDLQPGQRIKLTYVIADGTILRVKVLEKVEKLPARSSG